MAQYQLHTINALREEIIELNEYSHDPRYAFTVMDDLQILAGEVSGGTFHYYGDSEADLPSADNILHDANLLADVVGEDM